MTAGAWWTISKRIWLDAHENLQLYHEVFLCKNNWFWVSNLQLQKDSLKNLPHWTWWIFFACTFLITFRCSSHYRLFIPTKFTFHYLCQYFSILTQHTYRTHNKRRGTGTACRPSTVVHNFRPNAIFHKMRAQRKEWVKDFRPLCWHRKMNRL